MSDRTAEQALFDLVLYLVCAARLALEENLGLASFRLTEGASRAIAAAEALGIDPQGFLRDVLPTIDAEKLKVMHDLPGYTAALDEIQAAFIAESKRRDTAAAS